MFSLSVPNELTKSFNISMFYKLDLYTSKFSGRSPSKCSGTSTLFFGLSLKSSEGFLSATYIILTTV